MRKKLLKPIGTVNLKKIKKWVDENLDSDPLADLHYYACVSVGIKSPEDVSPYSERRLSKYKEKIYDELYEIRLMAFTVRDAYGRLILERIGMESKGDY